MTTTYVEQHDICSSADPSRPTQIPHGTVSSRIQNYQNNINNESRHENTIHHDSSFAWQRGDQLLHEDGSATLKTALPNVSHAKQESGNSDSFQACLGPFPTPSSTRPASNLEVVHPDEHNRPRHLTRSGFASSNFDGPSQLAAVRSQLRCITESNASQETESEGKESVLNELDTLLQSAINDQQSGEPQTRQANTRYHEKKPSTNNVFSPPASPRSYMNRTYTASILTALSSDVDAPPDHGAAAFAGKQNTANESSHTGHSNSHSRRNSTYQQHGRNSPPPEPASRPELHALPPIPTDADDDLDTSSKQPFFPRYRSQSIKKRVPAADMFGEGSERQQSLSRPMRHRSHMARPASINSTHTNIQADRHLLPLRLPRIVAARGSNEQRDQEFGSAVSYDTKAVRVATANRAQSPCITRQDVGPHGMHDIGRSEYFRKKPSLIEDRIQHLLAAARKHELNIEDRRQQEAKSGMTREKYLKENIRTPEDIDTKALPSFQIPLAEQADLLCDRKGPETPRKSHACCNTTSPILKQRIHNLSSRHQQSPLRPESRQLVDSISPRGSAYSFEQRFSISPSRSQSRAAHNAVRVSVELRRSPERGDSDDQMLFVRASVDPEDVDELNQLV